MIKSPTQPNASTSYGKWTTATEPPRVTITSSTKYELSDQVLLIQGKYVSGDSQLMVSVDPAAVERKLAIRELNAQLEGRTMKSQTYAKINYLD